MLLIVIGVNDTISKVNARSKTRMGGDCGEENSEKENFRKRYRDCSDIKRFRKRFY